MRNKELELEKQARLQDKLLRQNAVRDRETEENNFARLRDQSLRQEAVRGRETGEERLERAIADRFLHQVNLFEETEQDTAERRKQQMEVMFDYRATENEEETADRREKDRLQTELQREHQFQREREEEELRARNALQHAEIVPVETTEREAFLREMHLDRNRAGNPRTHRIACKDIVVEDRVHLLDIRDLTKICAECDAKHFEKEMPKDKKLDSDAAEREK